MRLIKSNSQKENLAKTFWDIGKVILTVLVLYPLAKESMSFFDLFIGMPVAILFMFIGFYIDGKGV